MVSANYLIHLIIIINPIRPALVVPKLVKIVQNQPHADSAILSITSSLTPPLPVPSPDEKGGGVTRTAT